MNLCQSNGYITLEFEHNIFAYAGFHSQEVDTENCTQLNETVQEYTKCTEAYTSNMY